MSWRTWLAFVVMETLLCITPGPAVLFVVAHGLARGGRASLAANGGIVAANTVYFFLSALGVGGILIASPRIFAMAGYAGASYLVVLGIQTIRGTGLAPARRINRAESGGAAHAFSRAFLVQASNPKAIVFFAALLPPFIDPAAPVARQMVILCVTSIVIEFAVLAAYGYLAGRAMKLAQEPRFVTVTNRVSGGMLVLAGLAIALR